ncbi:MAG TPA: DUF4836 family protein [Chitinophagaceae bacterium]|nr:DUF4836 family protein [Chitinophagaceae bacterium]
MNKIISTLSLLVTIIVFTTSCGKKAPSEAKYIPKDATSIVVINQKTLEEKLKSGNITLDSFINKMLDTKDSANAASLKKWQDFKNSGIDLDNNLYFFVVQKGSISKGLTTAVNIMAGLKDQAKFEKYIKEQKEFNAKNLIQENNFSYLSSIDTDLSLSWNKEIAIATFYKRDIKGSYDSVGNYIEPDKSETTKDKNEEVKRYFNLKENESVASVAYFNDMFKTKADGYIFGSTNSMLGFLASTPLNIPKVEELLKDNYTASTFNFENGKIEVNNTTYTNPMLSSILKKYSGSSVNTHLAEFFPTQNLNGTILISFKPEMFDGLLKELEIKGMLEAFLAQQGLTSADLFKLLSGEINIAMSDFVIENKEVTQKLYDGSTYTYNKTVPNFKLIATAPIGDKAAFTKIMDKAVENNLLAKTSTGYTSGEMLASSGMYFMADEKQIVIASSQDFYTTYLNNKTKSNLNSNIIADFKGKSMAAFIDINSIIKGFTPTAKDTTISNKVLAMVNTTFKNFIATTENFKDNSFKGKVTLNMVNEKQNSLVSIINLIDEASRWTLPIELLLSLERATSLFS